MEPTKAGDPADPKAVKAELVRLRIKRSETEDVDIRRALDERIAQLEAQMPAAPEEPIIDIPSEPPTPQQLAEAEQLVRQARVEKMRGNAKAATDLLKRAAEVAPGSPAVLETLADDLLERRQFSQAKEVYRRAVKLDPKNVGLERKFATTVAQFGSMGSLEDQMRANLSDSPFLGDASQASLPVAILCSLLWPGLGHVILGKRGGYVTMAIWLACCIWIVSMKDDVQGLISMAAGRGRVNPVVLAPLLIMAVVFFITMASLQSARKGITRRRIEHPRPPVDKPFEL